MKEARGASGSWLILVEEVAGDMGEDHLLQAGQVIKAVMKGFQGGLFEGLMRIGPFQVQKPAQGPHTPAGRPFLDLLYEPVKPLVLPGQSLLLAAGSLVGPLAMKRQNDGRRR